jgi:hypothetical protein
MKGLSAPTFRFGAVFRPCQLARGTLGVVEWDTLKGVPYRCNESLFVSLFHSNRYNEIDPNVSTNFN